MPLARPVAAAAPCVSPSEAPIVPGVAPCAGAMPHSPPSNHELAPAQRSALPTVGFGTGGSASVGHTSGPAPVPATMDDDAAAPDGQVDDAGPDPVVQLLAAAAVAAGVTPPSQPSTTFTEANARPAGAVPEAGSSHAFDVPGAPGDAGTGAVALGDRGATATVRTALPRLAPSRLPALPGVRLFRPSGTAGPDRSGTVSGPEPDISSTARP
jgi:hypothetical protein